MRRSPTGELACARSRAGSPRLLIRGKLYSGQEVSFHDDQRAARVRDACLRFKARCPSLRHVPRLHQPSARP